jgi:hypothetical protein
LDKDLEEAHIERSLREVRGRDSKGATTREAQDLEAGKKGKPNSPWEPPGRTNVANTSTRLQISRNMRQYCCCKSPVWCFVTPASLVRPFSVLESLHQPLVQYFEEQLCWSAVNFACQSPRKDLKDFIIHWMANVTLKCEGFKN